MMSDTCTNTFSVGIIQYSLATKIRCSKSMVDFFGVQQTIFLNFSLLKHIQSLMYFVIVNYQCVGFHRYRIRYIFKGKKQFQYTATFLQNFRVIPDCDVANQPLLIELKSVSIFCSHQWKYCESSFLFVKCRRLLVGNVL